MKNVWSPAWMEFDVTESIPDAPNIPHFLFRHPNERDFEHMANVVNASWDADLIDARISEEGVAQAWKYPQNFDPTKGAIVVERDGAVVGHGNVTWRQKPSISASIRITPFFCLNGESTIFEERW